VVVLAVAAVAPLGVCVVAGVEADAVAGAPCELTSLAKLCMYDSESLPCFAFVAAFENSFPSVSIAWMTKLAKVRC